MTVTQSSIVPNPPTEPRAPSTRHRWWAVPLAALGALAITGPVVAAFLPAKWFVDKPSCQGTSAADCAAEFALVPAAAEPVGARLQVAGLTESPHASNVYFVTVREPAITMLDFLATDHNPAVRLRSYRDKYGTGTEAELLREGQRQMSGAKEWATFVGLQAAGIDAVMKPGPAMVDYVICLQPNDTNTKCLEYAPANSVLQPDDVVTAVDGKPVTVLDDVPAALAGHKVGDVVDVTVQRGDQKVSGSVELIAAPGEQPERAILGFVSVDTRTLQLPTGVKVDFETNSIGGPSAGLAFTLALIDDVTPGDLLGGHDVAVTGTIDEQGNVGAIGGLNSKASAVKQVGVKYFLVPASQPDSGPDSAAAARQVAGDDVQIIPVATLKDALAAIGTLGGNLPAELRSDLRPAA